MDLVTMWDNFDESFRAEYMCDHLGIDVFGTLIEETLTQQPVALVSNVKILADVLQSHARNTTRPRPEVLVNWVMSVEPEQIMDMTDPDDFYMAAHFFAHSYLKFHMYVYEHIGKAMVVFLNIHSYDPTPTLKRAYYAIIDDTDKPPLYAAIL